jgi:hypothetical protein
MHCHRKGIDYHLERILSSISPSLFLSGLISLLHSANIFAPLVSVFSFVYLLGQGDPTCYNFLLWLQLTRPDWSRIEETEVFVDFVELSTLQIFFPFFVYWLKSYILFPIPQTRFSGGIRWPPVVGGFFSSLCDLIFWKEKLVQDRIPGQWIGNFWVGLLR